MISSILAPDPALPAAVPSSAPEWLVPTEAQPWTGVDVYP